MSLEARPDPELRPLTPREREVLRAISLGCKRKQIAADHFITEETVKSHMREILRKLEARNASHAVRLGFRAGVLP